MIYFSIWERIWANDEFFWIFRTFDFIYLFSIL